MNKPSIAVDIYSTSQNTDHNFRKYHLKINNIDFLDKDFTAI